MSGIAGYYNTTGSDQLLHAMTALMAHRGPDGEGYFRDDTCGLGHRALALGDDDAVAQPLASSDGRYVLCYDGEIFNAAALRQELVAAGCAFETTSAAETALQAFAHWGNSCFDRFEGAWALACYDKAERRLTLCRDHLGVKPIYFAEPHAAAGGPALIFGSEIKPVFLSGLIPREPNERAIYRYLRFRAHDDTAETFFAGIRKLLPGQMLVIDPSGVTIRAYTDLREQLLASSEAAGDTPYDAAMADEYRRHLEASIAECLRGPVPIGTSLSGGLDSSAITVLVSQLAPAMAEAGRPPNVGNVFSAIFPHQINDEERYADAAMASARPGLTLHKITPTADALRADMADFVRTQEEPTISTGPYVQYQLMREAGQRVRVMLDGQGADETMAGYVPYYAVHLRELRRQGRSGKLGKEARGSVDVLLRLSRFTIMDHLRLRKQISMATFLTPEFRRAHQAEKFPVVGDRLRARLLQDLYENSVPALLRYGDRNAMRFSVEGRAPFMSRDLLEYLFSLPDDAIISDGWNKRVLRDALTGVLPDIIVRRRNKIGLSSPETDWMMRLKNYFYEIFSSAEFAARPYFDQAAVLEAFDGFIRGKNAVGTMTFWRIANIELWLREFFDEPKAPKAARASDFEANHSKTLDLADTTRGIDWRRYPLGTEQVGPTTDLDDLVARHVKAFFDALPKQTAEHRDAVAGHPWYLFVSEKIVAITQGRSYFIWDIKPTWWADTLSRFVSRTPAGIGLGSPQTMQLAIQDVGLPRVLLASAVGAAGKLVGKRGLFYNLVGDSVRAIDGPTEYSVYPANVSAKLAPADPDGVAARLSERVRAVVPAEYADWFRGVVVMDANDFGQNVLGTNAPGDRHRYEAAFADNPLDQTDQLTPLCVVVERPLQ